jgi:hypothetical protein
MEADHGELMLQFAETISEIEALEPVLDGVVAARSASFDTTPRCRSEILYT